MSQNDLQGYLTSVPGTDNDRASAWDVVNGAKDQDDFQQRVGSLNIPKEAKADLWDYKYGNKPLTQFKGAAIAAPVDTPTNPRPNPSTPEPGVLSKVWGWANEPINVGHLRQSLKESHAIADAPVTMQDVDEAQNHPILHAVHQAKKAVAGFGADAGDMLATPLSATMAAAGLLTGGVTADSAALVKAGALDAPIATKTALAAKSALAAAGVGFGVHGASDIVDQPGRQANETSDAYARRMLGNAAGIVGGAAGIAETPHLVSDLRNNLSANPAPAPVPVTVPRAVPPEIRKAQAVGNPKGAATAKTVYVDPEFAAHLNDWNKADLPGKRVKLQTTKSGVTSMKLAHSEDGVKGFQYTNPPEGVNAEVSETGAAGQVPVTLNSVKGGRGTRGTGQYLDVQVGQAAPEVAGIAATPKTPMASPGPELPLAAAGTPAKLQPLPEPPAMPPAPLSGPNSPEAVPQVVPQFAPQQTTVVEPANPVTGAKEVSLPTQNPEPVATPSVSNGGVGPGVSNPLPTDLAKAAPKYGYGKKNFNLQFEDPADLAAYTYAQDKTNKAQGRFEDYLLKEFPGSDPESLRNYGNTVKATIKASAKDAKVEEGPLKVPSHRNLVDATGHLESQQPAVEPPTKGFEEINSPNAPEVAPKPSAPTQTDLSPIEDKIRPLVGQLMNLKRLQTGEKVHGLIDAAVYSSRRQSGMVEDVANRVSKLLGEDVGTHLTDDQIARLDEMRGGKMSQEPKFTYRTAREADLIRAGRWAGGKQYAEEFEDRLQKSDIRILEALKNPDTPEPLRAKLQSAMEPDANGGRKYVLYEPGMEYPGPKQIAADHIEEPFTPAQHRTGEKLQLGHKISGISLRNLTVALGKQPKDMLFRRSDKFPFTSSEELAKLSELDRAANAGTENTNPQANPSTAFMDVVGNKGEERGSTLKVDPDTGKGSPVDLYRRSLYQKALVGRIGELSRDLQKHTAEWNKQNPSNVSELRQQLDKLPPSTRELLPQELFNETQPLATETGTTGETSKPQEPVETSNTPSATATSVGTGTGEEAPVEGDGLRTNQFERSIAVKFPESVENAADLRDHVVNRNLSPKLSQKLYDRTLQVYHDRLEAQDPFALKKAYEMASAPLKKPQGGLNMSLMGVDQVGKAVVDLAEKLQSKTVYTPEQLHDINYEASSMMLDRWEKMSESELYKKKEGLWKDSLVQRIEQAAPTSTDPELHQQQADNYNELHDRLKELKEQVGPSTNLSSRLVDMFSQFADQRELQSNARQTMREVLGKTYRDNAILRQDFDSFDQLMNALPIPEQDRFFDSMNRGSAQVPDLFNEAIDPNTLARWSKKNGPLPDPNEVASAVRESLDGARNRLTDASGKLEEFFVNYMPGMYDNVAAAKNFAQSWASHRPLAGDSGFLKQRMYEFHADALKAGLTPVTSNPVRAAMMRIEQLNRFTMAHEFKNRLIAQGGADWYANGETPPVGHEALNDSLFGQRGIGQFYAPQAVARTFNNFVSSGLTGGWRVPFTNFSLYDALLHTNSLANQMQLGLSWFHATETMLNSGFSTMATGLRQMVNEGKVVKGGINVAKGATFIMPLMEDAWNGSKGLVNFRDPTKNVQYGEFNHDLEMANANVQTKGGFHLEEIEKLKQNWATAMDDTQKAHTRAWAVTNAGVNALRSTVEATSWPLMNKLIPAVKAGAFYRMADQIHEQMANQPPENVNLELQKAWDSVDNRFGQVNYDNMFLSKVARDAAKLLVRSPGWNIGTFREVGGGLFDLAKATSDASNGKGFQISNRTAYTAAMVMGTMWMNNIYQYMKTGTFPHGVENLFPWDGTKTAQGEKNHVYPKTYVYDAINFAHAPLSTAWHKSAPGISTLADLVQNKDYYGREIRNPGASVPANAAATLGYLAHQFLPFSVGNLQESKLRNQKSNWESFAGVLPAPRWATRSNAENLANTYYEGTMGSGAKSEWEMEHQRTLIDLRNRFRAGDLKQDEIQKAVAAGKLSPRSIKYIVAPADTQSNLERWTSRLTDPTQAWNVWEASTPEEKKLLLPTMIKKVSTQFTGEEQQQKFKEIQDYMNTKR